MANFLFMLTREEIDPVTRCFQLAKIAHGQGHQVDIFFLDDGTKWADNTRDFKVASGTGDCPDDYLPYLVENEVPIGV